MENDLVGTGGQMCANSASHTWNLRRTDEPDVEPALVQLSGHMNDTQQRAFQAKLLIRLPFLWVEV